MKLLVLLLATVISGCVNQPQPQRSEPAVNTPVVKAPAPSRNSQPPQVPEVSARVPVVPTNSAVASLIKQARLHYTAQDYQSAIATAERGLRIDRRAAELYLVLAQSYLQLALPQQAQTFVQQGLRYAQQGSEVAQGLLQVRDMAER